MLTRGPAIKKGNASAAMRNTAIAMRNPTTAKRSTPQSERYQAAAKRSLVYLATTTLTVSSPAFRVYAPSANERTSTFNDS